MAPQKDDDVPERQVNHILHNLRGEHFRHARNAQGKRAVSASQPLQSGPTLPVDLIYPAPFTTEPAPPRRVPGPSPPRSWRSHAPPGPETVADADRRSPAWRQRALSPLFSADPRAIPDSAPIPPLSLLCFQLIRTDLADLASYLPPHLRRALMRHTAVCAPLSQTELDALRQGATHIDSDLVVVGPGNVLRASFFAKHGNGHPAGADADSDHPEDAWDAVRVQDDDDELHSLAILCSPLSAMTLLAFPPTITHLALLGVPHRVPLQRLPTICPLLLFLDLSYNTWLTAQMLEDEIEWTRLRRLEVVGLRGCSVTPKVLLELNRGRWKDTRVIR